MSHGHRQLVSGVRHTFQRAICWLTQMLVSTSFHLQCMWSMHWPITGNCWAHARMLTSGWSASKCWCCKLGPEVSADHSASKAMHMVPNCPILPVCAGWHQRPRTCTKSWLTLLSRLRASLGSTDAWVYSGKSLSCCARRISPQAPLVLLCWKL